MLTKNDIITIARDSGSTATTYEGARRYLRAHHIPIIPAVGSAQCRPGKRKTTRAQWAAMAHERRSERRAAARCAAEGLAPRGTRVDDPRARIIAGAYGLASAAGVGGLHAVRGWQPPTEAGTGYGFRWRGRWKSAPGSYEPSTRRVEVGDQWLAGALSTLPTHAAHTASSGALAGEITTAAPRSMGAGVRLRWEADDRGRWHRVGVAVPTPYGWEHGVNLAACRGELARKAEIAAAQDAARVAAALDPAREERRARLVARLCHRALVRAADVRGAGACMAGIQAWCRSRGVDIEDAVSLPALYADLAARPWALKVAATVRRQTA